MTHTTESMVTQADFEAIMDRLEKGPMNLTGKSWRDTPDDPLVAEVREHFILPVIEEYIARHRTAAQPEREAVLEEAARFVETHAYVTTSGVPAMELSPMVEFDTHHKTIAAAIRALKTTPAPASEREAVQIGTRCNHCGTAAPEAFAAQCYRPECEYRAALTTPTPAVSTGEE